MFEKGYASRKGRSLLNFYLLGCLFSPALCIPEVEWCFNVVSRVSTSPHSLSPPTHSSMATS
ncbi:hypothetical protein J6590_025116 [Homalodisca vitripennis]|nr:hypothetical protein J6590_025116 [Homalodisca vitripennis]